MTADEDAKLVTLARGARLRAYAPYGKEPAGAAVRDTDGRTYVGATVENAAGELTTTALRAAVVAAAASGARAFEAAVHVGEADPTAADLTVLREFGADVPVLVAGPDGSVRTRLSS